VTSVGITAASADPSLASSPESTGHSQCLGRAGDKFSLMPAFTMVEAMVLRISAFHTAEVTARGHAAAGLAQHRGIVALRQISAAPSSAMPLASAANRRGSAGLRSDRDPSASLASA